MIRSGDWGDEILNMGIKQFDFSSGKLYKYLDVEGATKLIENNTIKFTAPSELNDPFDFNAKFLDYELTDEELIGWMYLMFVGRPNRLSLIREILTRKTKQEISNDIGKVIEEFTAKCGICCFSTKHNDNLMWSHYATKHTGICLGFKMLDPNFTIKNDIMALRVNYVEKLERKKVFEKQRLDLALFYLMFTKQKQWDYEDEVRLVCISANGFAKFEKSFLTDVYFGMKMPDDTIKKIQTSLVANGYNNFTCHRMTIDPITSGLTNLPMNTAPAQL